MHSARRTSVNPSFASSIPSIVTDPPANSVIRNSAIIIDDFPAPVRPTIPSFSPGSTVRFTPFSTSGPSRYRNATSFISIRPSLGHPSGGRTSVIIGVSGFAELI